MLTTVTTLLDASRTRDAETVHKLSEFADDQPRTVQDIAEALERNAQFWNYESWELKESWTPTLAFGQRWSVTVEMHYASGYQHLIDFWLVKRNDGWKVRAVTRTP